MHNRIEILTERDTGRERGTSKDQGERTKADEREGLVVRERERERDR